MSRRAHSAKTVAALVALVLGLASGADPAVSQEGGTGGQTGAGVALDAPKLQTESWALTDADSGLYLAGKNPDERLPIASTTKVMVALVALEEGVDLDEEVTVSKEAERFVGFTFSNVGLIAEEDVLGLADPGLETERRITEKEPPPAARAGQQLGTVELLVDGQSIGSTPLVAQKGYEEASLWQKIKYWVGGLVERVSG
jgi:D-alanyl-D-alanine carboxypeptidase